MGIYTRSKGWFRDVNEHLRNFPRIVWFVVLAYVSSLVVYGINLDFWPFSDSVAEWGQFGDFIGGFINPLVGLGTIILLASTLQQNDLMLDRASKSLAEAQRSANLSRESENFDRAVELIRVYEQTVQELEAKVAALTNPRVVGIGNNKFKAAESRRRIQFLKEKIATLVHLLDLEFDFLVDTMIASVNYKNHLVDGFQYTELIYEIKFISAFDRLRIKIGRPEEIGPIYDIYLDAESSQNEELLKRRANAIENGHVIAKKLIDHFNVHGNFNLPSEDSPK